MFILFDEFTIIWNTDDLKRFKPSPFDEARWGLAIIEDSLWDTIPKVYRRLNSIFIQNMGKSLPKNFNPIEFGSWMGGDRDGNPNVTIDENSILIIRGCGPVGYPGSAEVVNMQPPDKLLKKGINTLPTLGDGRQSGTSESPSILNVSPESAVGGDLLIIKTGDKIKIDLNNKVLNSEKDIYQIKIV